jgi:putative transposase
LNTLKEQSDKFGCAVHAYVLMTNHMHLLLTPSQSESVALTVKQLGQRYVQYINRTYRRSGTLWEGRYKSCLMQDEAYVLAMKYGLGLNKILGTIHSYPTMVEANKYAAGLWKQGHKPEKVLQWVEKFHAFYR